MYRTDKTLLAKKKGHDIMKNLEDERREVEKLLKTHQPYDEQRMYEKIYDSLTRSIDDIRRSLL